MATCLELEGNHEADSTSNTKSISLSPEELVTNPDNFCFHNESSVIYFSKTNQGYDNPSHPDSEDNSLTDTFSHSGRDRIFGKRNQLFITPERSYWEQPAYCGSAESSIIRPRTFVLHELEVVPLAVPSSPIFYINNTDEVHKKIQTELEMASEKLSYIAVTQSDGNML